MKKLMMMVAGLMIAGTVSATEPAEYTLSFEQVQSAMETLRAEYDNNQNAYYIDETATHALRRRADGQYEIVVVMRIRDGARFVPKSAN